MTASNKGVFNFGFTLLSEGVAIEVLLELSRECVFGLGGLDASVKRVAESTDRFRRSR